MYRGERALKAVSRSFRMLKLSQTRSRLLDSTMTNLPALGSAVFEAFSALCSSIVPPGRKESPDWRAQPGPRLAASSPNIDQTTSCLACTTRRLMSASKRPVRSGINMDGYA